MSPWGHLRPPASTLLWDFLVADKSLERWILGPIRIYNWSFSLMILKYFKLEKLLSHQFLCLLFHNREERRHWRKAQTELLFYFYVSHARGNSDILDSLLIALMHRKARLCLAPKAEPIMVTIYWKTWWNGILKADSPWCSEFIKIYFSSCNIDCSPFLKNTKIRGGCFPSARAKDTLCLWTLVPCTSIFQILVFGPCYMNSLLLGLIYWLD